MREPVPPAPDGQPLLSDLLLADRGVILYLDTSALAKLFLTEPGSDQLAAAVCSSLAKAVRMGWVVAYSLELRLQDFKDRWASLDVVATTDALVRRDCILFFDEADALFGKRSETNDAHDRSANQEVAYLLHRNLDEAFLRRFEAVVYFPPPRVEERLRLWSEGFSPRARVTADLERIAHEHDLTGGAIINVIRKVSLAAIARVGQDISDGEHGHKVSDPTEIGDSEINEAIRSEQGKQG